MIPPTRKIFAAAVLLVLFQPTMFAQAVNEINIRGNSEFSRDDYLSWTGLKKGIKLHVPPDSLVKAIQTNLAGYGYFNPHIEIDVVEIPGDSAMLNVDISINENEPTFINQIILYGYENNGGGELFNLFDILENTIFTKQKMESTFSSALNYFENNGYPFASVKIESIFFFFDSLQAKYLADIYLSLPAERTSKIDEIRITGNTKTKDYVIKRNIRIKEGDNYSQSRIDNIPNVLNRLRIFERVEPASYYFNPTDRAILEISVAEKSTNSFDGIVGYVPSVQKGGGGFFTGFINIALRNIFGTQRALSFKWHKQDRHSQELEVKYFEPWILDFPVNVQAELFQRIQDTTYVQRKVEGFFELMATDEISASLILGTESTIPTEPDKRGFTVFNSSSIISGLSLKIDSRDDPYSPMSGLYFNNTYKYNTKKINGPEPFILPSTKLKTELQRFELDLIYFLSVMQRQVLSAGVHAREMRGGRFELSDYYKLGGTNNLRGYQENQFLGNRIFWSNLEYRYLLARRSFAFLFFDTGYYLREGDAEFNTEKISSFKYGYGLGLSIETGLGIIAVSFALGGKDSFSEGKIHLGLLNDF